MSINEGLMRQYCHTHRLIVIYCAKRISYIAYDKQGIISCIFALYACIHVTYSYIRIKLREIFNWFIRPPN